MLGDQPSVYCVHGMPFDEQRMGGMVAKGWIRILAFAVAGLLLGGGIRLLFLPRPIQWEKFPPAPSPVTTLLNICEGTIYVKTADGATLQRTWGDNEQWSPSASDTGCKGYPTVTKSCDFSSEPFATSTHLPTDIRDCLQGYTQYPEGYRNEAYVLDSARNVWRWHLNYWAGVSGEISIWGFLFTTAPLFCCPVVGVLIALLSLLAQRRAAKVQS
jgi:hypothetical protein